jgi:putative transposase
MIVWLRHFVGWAVSAFRSREDLILENLALRQQLLTFHAQRPRRRLTGSHKLFWVVLRKVWSGWQQPLIVVTPRTVVGWHRAGFRLYWRWLSKARSRGGRKPVSKEIRALIFQMVAENPTWGAPRIHGELLKLGLDVSEPTVSRWLRRAPRSPDLAKRWLTFIGHDRRRILHHNVTRNPNSLWVALQLRETWENGDQPQRLLIFDRDSKFSVDVVSTAKAMGSQTIRTAFRSPGQKELPSAGSAVYVENSWIM